MLEKWFFHRCNKIITFLQEFKTDVWIKQIHVEEEIYFARDCFWTVLDYCDYSIICNVTTKFPDLIPNIFKNVIILPLYASQKDTEWRDSHIPCSDIFVNQTNRQKSGDYISEIYYVQETSVHKRGVHMIMTRKYLSIFRQKNCKILYLFLKSQSNI